MSPGVSPWPTAHMNEPKDTGLAHGRYTPLHCHGRPGGGVRGPAGRAVEHAAGDQSEPQPDPDALAGGPAVPCHPDHDGPGVSAAAVARRPKCAVLTW